MFVTALVELPSFSPSSARRLGAALGCSPMEAAGRLQVPGRGPAVVARYDERALAEARLAALTEAGFAGFVLGPPWPRAVTVREVVVVDADLVLTLTDESRHVLSGGQVAAVVRGNRVVPKGTLEKVGERSFKVGQSDGAGRLTWATQTETITKPTMEERRFPFLRIFAEGGRVVRIDEPLLRTPGERAFGLLARAIRRACNAAPYDERLLAYKTQAQMLGPGLPPERHGELAVILVAQAMLRAGR